MLRLILASLLLLAVPAFAADKPNILVILADDLGYADVGFQGSKDIPTPNLDKLATQSVHCTSGYVSHPFCSPTRAGLMTGRYQQHFGHENNPAYLPESTIAGLPIDQVTLPQLLKKAGYTTGMVGKWHLGAHPQFHPNERGFEEFFGFLGGGHVYFKDAKGGVEYNVPLQFNGQERPFDGYLTSILGREAAAYVDRHKGSQWFLYMAFNAPHTPLQAPEKLVSNFVSIPDTNRQSYAAMVYAMDEAVGEVLTKLDATGQRGNTLIFFFSDNGGPHLSFRGLTDFTDNSPLRGAKGDVLEGGIRIPFLVSWPAKLKPGKYEQPVISLDVLPTALAVAGGELPVDRHYDGVNLIPYLSGENASPPHETLFWRSGGPGGKYAARSGNWKFVREGTSAPELYDLSADIGESHNLATEQPAALRKMEAAVAEWDKLNIEPIFGSPRATENKAAAKKKASGKKK